jgi:AraC family transcriptional regulator
MKELQTGLAAAASPTATPSGSFVRIDPADIAFRRMNAWTGIHADVVEMQKRDPFEYGTRPAHHLLIAADRAARDDGETTVEGLPVSTLREFSRKMTFVPAGHSFHGWQRPRALMRTTYFYIDPRSSLIDPDLRFAEAELQPRLFFFDRDLWETAAKLKSQALDPDPGQQSYAEALGLVLIHEILRMQNGVSQAKTNARGGLAAWQKKCVTDFIEQHLGEDVSLADLAGLVRLSPFHFARAFRQSFELPPHRYLTTRRLDRAKTLLAEPQLSVTEIGVQVGFSDTSAFSSTFRKHVGLSPTEYRRGLE